MAGGAFLLGIPVYLAQRATMTDPATGARVRSPSDDRRGDA